jgi:anti-sigma B factor antagonist
MDSSINISLSEREKDDISEVRVDGVIDTITASELEKVIDSLINRHRYRILIDLAGVEYISSAGWGIFISHIKEARANDGDIKLVNMIDNVYEIYELLEFENVLKAYNGIDDARSDFGVSPVEAGLKKKDYATTTLTVVDRLSPHTADGARVSVPGGNGSGLDSDMVVRVLKSVKQDPFVSIGEMRRDLNRRSSSSRVGWWQVFFILKRQKLLTRRSRFRYARSYYRS